MQSRHNLGESYGNKEKQAIVALLEAGADAKGEVVAAALNSHTEIVTKVSI